MGPINRTTRLAVRETREYGKTQHELSAIYEALYEVASLEDRLQEARQKARTLCVDLAKRTEFDAATEELLSVTVFASDLIGELRPVVKPEAKRDLKERLLAELKQEGVTVDKVPEIVDAVFSLKQWIKKFYVHTESERAKKGPYRMQPRLLRYTVEKDAAACTVVPPGVLDEALDKIYALLSLLPRA